MIQKNPSVLSALLSGNSTPECTEATKQQRHLKKIAEDKARREKIILARILKEFTFLECCSTKYQENLPDSRPFNSKTHTNF